MPDYLEFEKPLKELQDRIDRLSKSKSQKGSVQRLIRMLTLRRSQLEQEIYSHLTPWQRTQIARHADRPSAMDYIESLVENFIELHGDRVFGDDQSIVSGFGAMAEQSVCLIGHEKGKGVKDRVKRNFGMPHPEGYRKALRIMKLAEKFQRPVITFIDTPGAYPGVGAEERGQSEAIARNLFAMSRLRVPILSVVIGEGGSGGALALGVADRVLILEHAIYSVISPEGCAAILWEDAGKAQEAAEALKMTGEELFKLGVIDEIISEPVGGAHRDKDQAIANVFQAIETHLHDLTKIPVDKLLIARQEKYRRMMALDTSSNL